MDPNVTLSQLAGVAAGGAQRLKAMIGARDFTRFDADNSVAFKFMQGARNKANYIKITLNGLDLYDIEYGRIWGMDYKVVQNRVNIYEDSLKDFFEDDTGLALSL